MGNCVFMHDPSYKPPISLRAGSHASNADTARLFLRFVSKSTEGSCHACPDKRSGPSTTFKVALDDEEQSTPLSPLKLPPLPNLALCKGASLCRGDCLADSQIGTGPDDAREGAHATPQLFEDTAGGAWF